MSIFDRWNKFFVSLGVGLLPKAPGTWGSLLGLALMVLLWPTMSVGIILFVVSSVLWFVSVHRYISVTGDHDPKEVIVDEVLGLWLTLSPLLGGPISWSLVGLGFVVFRVLDILKPGPIGWVDQKAPGVWGVMGDDLLAGVFGAIILQLVLWAV